MLTKELTHNQLNTRQTRRFARLISFFKKPEEQTRSSFHEDRLEKMTWHTRSRVDIGSMIRNR